MAQIIAYFAVQLLLVNASLQMPSELMRHRLFLSVYVPRIVQMSVIGYCPPRHSYTSFAQGV